LARFVESAVLKVIDQSSKPLSNIQRALRQVQNEADKLSKFGAALAIPKSSSLHARAMAASLATGASESAKMARAVSRMGATMARLAGEANYMARGMRMASDAAARLNKHGGGAAFKASDFMAPRVGLERLAHSYDKAAAAAERFSRLSRQAATFNPPPAKPTLSQRAFDASQPISQRRRLYGRGYQTVPEAAGHQASHATVSAARAAFSSGGRQAVDADTARAALKLKGLPEDQRAIIEREAQKLTKEFRAVPLGEMIETLGDAALQTADFSKFSETARLMASTLQVHTARTGDAAEGKRAAVVIGKAVDAMGRADDPGQARSYMEAISRAMIASGRDLRPDTLLAIMRNLKSTKMGVTAGGVEDIASLGDEAGQRIGNSISQLESFLSGAGKKKSHAEMRRIGLEGRDGKQKVPYAGNPIDYVMDTFGPALRKAGVDTSNPEQLGSYLRGKLSVKDTIADAISLILSKEAEIRRNRENRARMDVSPEASAALAFGSLAMTGQSLDASFGKLTDSVVGKVTPALLGMGDTAAGLMDKASGAMKGSSVSPTGAAVGTTAALAGVAGVTKFGLGKLIETAFPGSPVMAGIGKGMSRFGGVLLKGAGAVGTAVTAAEAIRYLIETDRAERERQKSLGTPLGKSFEEGDKRRSERAERTRAAIRKLVDQAEAMSRPRLPSLARWPGAGVDRPLTASEKIMRAQGEGNQQIQSWIANLDKPFATFDATVSGLPAKGAEMGQAFTSTLNPAGIGAAIGEAAASIIRSATVNVNTSKPVNTGTNAIGLR